MAKRPKDNQLRNRIRILCFLFLGAVTLLAAKAVDTQVRLGDFLARKAENNYVTTLTIAGDRGQILDRNQNKLGANIDMLTVLATPYQVKKDQDTAGKLARLLDLDKGQLSARLYTQRGYARVKENITQDKAREIRNLGLSGIYFQKSSKRFYPNRELASQVMGFTGRNGAGREGLEYKFNQQLAGKQLKVNVKRAGDGRILDIDTRRRSQLAGDSIVLTLDKQIQFLSEQTLARTVEKHQAKSGMALVLRPSTGELLSIAHYPKFNPNTVVDYKKGFWRNRAATDAFEPGSVMKIFTVAAALEKGMNPGDSIYCENGKYKVGRYTIKDTHPYEWLNINEILQFSSNIGSAKISETIGGKALYHYLARFGFGKKPNSGSPGETGGTLATYDQWADIDRDTIAFGQGMAASAVQIIAGMGAIANDGILMQPMLIKKIVSNDGKDLQVFHPTPVGRVVSSKTADAVKTMMNLAVGDEGTGSKARLDGYPVCGKTGTAQKASKGRKGYSKSRYVSVFAGFAPQRDPKLAVLVVVDEPREKYYGGDVAAPAFKSIMAQSFNYLNIPPETPRNLVAALTRGETQ